MTKLTAKKALGSTANNQQKHLAEAALLADEYLDGAVTNGRVDLDKRIHKALKNLANATENPVKAADNSVNIKSVTLRMLITESLLDLFDKYERGEGKYPFDTDEDWSWLKQK